MGFFKFLEASAWSGRASGGPPSEAYETVDEGCEVYDDARVAGHCWSGDVDAKGDPKQLQKADALLRRAVSRLEKVPSRAARGATMTWPDPSDRRRTSEEALVSSEMRRPAAGGQRDAAEAAR